MTKYLGALLLLVASSYSYSATLLQLQMPVGKIVLSDKPCTTQPNQSNDKLQAYRIENGKPVESGCYFVDKFGYQEGPTAEITWDNGIHTKHLLQRFTPYTEPNSI